MRGCGWNGRSPIRKRVTMGKRFVLSWQCYCTKMVYNFYHLNLRWCLQLCVCLIVVYLAFTFLFGVGILHSAKPGEVERILNKGDQSFSSMFVQKIRH